MGCFSILLTFGGVFECVSSGFPEKRLLSGKGGGVGLVVTFPLRIRWGGYVVGFFL
tara:strand:- start:434 stop:601 length:168 start_codon:yes stop_codon:yes gene_type:complete